MKKVLEFIKKNSQSIKETIEYGYLVCAMLLMFMGRTGAIVSFASLVVIIISSNFSINIKKDDCEKERRVKPNIRSQHSSKRYVA